VTNILVTRPKHQAGGLCDLIEQQGWDAVRFPTLKIVAVKSNKIEQQIGTIEQYQWLIFISSNAVNFALKANGGKIEHFQKSLIAAVGKTTEKALSAAGLKVNLVPMLAFNTEGLLATEEMMHVKGRSCLIIRGDGGRETLAQCLRERGATVDYMEVYSREIPLDNKINVSQMLEQDKLDAITITSGDALKHLLIMVDNELHAKLTLIPLIVISERIKVLAEMYKFKRIAVTDAPNDAAIIKTVVMSLETQ